MSSLLILFTLLPGKAYMQMHEYREAYRYFLLESSIQPTDTSYYNASICALTQDDYDIAYDFLQEVDAPFPDLYYYLGLVQYRKHADEKAHEFFLRATTASTASWQANYYIGLIHLKANRIDEASKFLREIPDTVDRSMIVPYIENYDLLVEARKRYENGDYQKAIDIYRNVQYYFGYREIGLAYAYASLHEYGQCLYLLDSVISAPVPKELIVQSLFLAAQVSIASENIVRARNYLRALLALEPDDQGRYLLGKTYSDEVRYDSAYVCFKGLPDSIDEYLFFKARTEYFLGLWGPAEEKMLRHRELFPHSVFGDRAVYILASINYKRNEYEHAIDFFKELVITYPQSVYAASAQRYIGSAYYALQEYRNALNAYQRVSDYQPSRNIEEETTLLIYETRYRLGMYYTLIDALRSFISNNQTSCLVPRTRMRIAKILLEQREYYQCLNELDRISELHSEQPIVHEAQLEKARVYGLLGNSYKQKETLHDLLDLQEAKALHAYVANELAVIYNKDAKYDSSLHYYNTLLDDKRYREKAMYEIARIYYTLGQYYEAETMVDKLIEEYPSSVFLFQSYLIKAQVYKHDGNYDMAIQLFEDLLKKLGAQPEIYMELGNLYAETEEFLLARDHYLSACEYFKQNRDGAAEALLSAGEASVAIGDIVQAREYFLQAHLIAESIVLKDRVTARLSTISEN